MLLHELPAHLAELADQVEANAHDPGAVKAYRRSAEIAREALEGHLDEMLGPEEAEAESGYTWDHLRRIRPRIVRDGRVRRRDLPKKPGHQVATGPVLHPSSEAQAVRSVAKGGR